MNTPDDFHRLERVITGLMRGGVALSSSVLLVGLVLAAAGMTSAVPVLNVGLVLLMLIPATRILVSLVDAAVRRDLLLAGATLFVTVLLAGQIFGWFERWLA
ncbi:MAG: DUF1634 domain-containing protein [Acidobacteria bacterium]|nr:DUF1634 domain-containing protein [Acidobacteriota bacterium]